MHPTWIEWRTAACLLLALLGIDANAWSGNASPEATLRETTLRDTASRDTTNRLTPAEKRAGWILLFDGSTLDGWQSPISSSPPADWSVHDGSIALHHEGEYFDLITRKDYADFELTFEWRISQGGNSGVFYHVRPEVSDRSWKSGLEYQLLDNSHGEAPIEQAGALFDLYAPDRDLTKPVGEWNSGRIVVRGHHVEHWMNGHRLLQAELQSADFQARVAQAKFKDFPRWATYAEGRIALQDHGDDVAFRNLKLRPLTP